MDKPTEVEFDPDFNQHLSDAYRHADGSITYIVYDTEPGDTPSPRDDETIATLIQTDRNYIAIDEDTAYLGEAHERFSLYNERSDKGWSGPEFMMRHLRLAARSKYDREAMVRRYISIFRPDILYYTESWDAYTSQSGGSSGWGYVTREAWEEAMGTDYGGDLTPEKAFDQEVDLYRKWAGGEVFGGCHVTVGEPIVIFGDHGAYIDGYTTNEDWCWGFLGYEDNKDITEQFTDSPITEVLA